MKAHVGNNLLPTMVGTLRYLPAGNALWIDVRVKSPSIDCPVEEPADAIKTSTGRFLMQSSFSEALELRRG